jgi:hypothetical protein
MDKLVGAVAAHARRYRLLLDKLRSQLFGSRVSQVRHQTQTFRRQAVAEKANRACLDFYCTARPGRQCSAPCLHIDCAYIRNTVSSGLGFQLKSLDRLQIMRRNPINLGISFHVILLSLSFGQLAHDYVSVRVTSGPFVQAS